MPVLPVLPVEVWQLILRFSISTGFLDPDTYEGDLWAKGFGEADHSRHRQSTYGESERTRKTLQRVCKAWDAYLRCFEHRYVHMNDIIHRRIDEKSIKKAIGVSFHPDWLTCRRSCCSAEDSFLQLCCEMLLGLHGLPAEIIDIGGELAYPLWNAGVLRNLKQVKVIRSWEIHGDSIALPLFSQTPSLKHLIGTVHDDFQHLQFISRTLVTFSLELSSEESYKTLILDLPALCHLRISFGDRMNPLMLLENILVPFFAKVGDQLRSLHWDRRHQMPVEIWERCPHLEVFHPGLALPVTPPVLPQVHTLSVISDAMPQALRLQWPKLRRLILSEPWAIKYDPERLRELFTLWADNFQGSGVTFEDKSGISLERIMELGDLI